MSTGPRIVVQFTGGTHCQLLFSATSSCLDALDLPPWRLADDEAIDPPPDCWIVVGRAVAEQPIQDGYLVDLDLHNPDDLRHPLLLAWRQTHPRAIPAAARPARHARLILCQTVVRFAEANFAEETPPAAEPTIGRYADTIARRIALWSRFWNREAMPLLKNRATG